FLAQHAHQRQPLALVELLQHVADIGAVQRRHDQRHVLRAARFDEGPQSLQPKRADPAFRIAEGIVVDPGFEAGRHFGFVAHREPFRVLIVSGAEQAVANRPALRQCGRKAFSPIRGDFDMTDNANLDAGFARLLRLVQARNLAPVEASTSYGTPALKVGDAAFVRMLDAQTAVLQCPVDQKVLLMEISPDIYYETEHYVGYDAMLVRLDRIDD